MIRSDLLRIFDALRDREIALTIIYTNGWLVDEKLLDAIVLLLAGFIIFAVVSRMESTYPLKMDFISANLITGEIPYDQMDHFSVGMPVRIAGETGHIRSVYSSARVLLDFNPDSKANFEEGLYVMSIGEKENVSVDEMSF